jgi:hypothetical protein
MRGIETIYRSKTISAHHRVGRSRWTLVVFGDAGLVGQRLDMPRRGFIEKADLSAVIIVAHRRTWYPREQILPCLEAVRTIVANAPVVTYGASMGGYAAIKYSSLLQAIHTVAIAPQFSIDPAIIKLKSDPFVVHFKPDLNAGMDIAIGDAVCPVDIVFDPLQENDLEHVSLICRKFPCRLTHVRHAGHPSEVIFGGGTDIADLISDCMIGNNASITLRIRRNKRRSVYFHMCLYRALCDSKPAFARWALTAASRLPPLGTDDRISRAQAQLKLGRAHIAAQEL